MNKKNIYILFSIVFLQALVFYYPISTLYRTNYGLTLTDIMIIESISFIITMLFELPWGILADKIGYKKVLLLSNILFLFSKIIFYYANSYNLFFLERIILGITIAGLSGCDTSLLYKSCGDKNSKNIFAVYSFLGTAGLLAASLSYSIFMKSNYKLCALYTVIAYLLAVLLTFFLDDYKSDNLNINKTSSNLFTAIKKHLSYLLIVISSILFTETIRECVVFFAQVKLTDIGLSPTYLGLVSSSITIIGMSSILSGKLQEYISIKTLIISAYILGILCLFIIGYSHSIILVVLMLMLINLLDTLLNPALVNYEQQQVEDAHRASILSFYSVIGSSLSCGIDIVLGYVGDISINYSYILGAVFIFIALLLSIIYFKLKRKKDSLCL